jgi:hypothetical protein
MYSPGFDVLFLSYGGRERAAGVAANVVAAWRGTPSV